MLKWNGLEIIGRFCLAGWPFDIPMFYRSVALAKDLDRRQMSHDAYLEPFTQDLPSYSNAWWKRGGGKVPSISDMLRFDCSQVGCLFFICVYHYFLNEAQQIMIDDEMFTPVTDRIMKQLRDMLELLKRECAVEDVDLMVMLGEVEKIRHLY